MKEPYGFRTKDNTDDYVAEEAGIGKLTEGMKAAVQNHLECDPSESESAHAVLATEQVCRATRFATIICSAINIQTPP